MSDRPDAELARVSGLVVAMVTAYEAGLTREGARIWGEMTDREREVAMIACMSWLHSLLVEIERRGGPPPDFVLHRLGLGVAREGT